MTENIYSFKKMQEICQQHFDTFPIKDPATRVLETIPSWA